MTGEELRVELINMGALLTVRGDYLGVSPSSVLTHELRTLIRKHKLELINYVQNRDEMKRVLEIVYETPHLRTQFESELEEKANKLDQSFKRQENTLINEARSSTEHNISHNKVTLERLKAWEEAMIQTQNAWLERSRQDQI